MNAKIAPKIAIVMLSGLLAACAPQPAPAPAPAPAPPPPPAAAPAPTPAVSASTDRWVTIQAATCQQLLGLDADDRAAASMFYIGYTARRFGNRAINVSAIPSIEGLAVDYCGINPSRTAASAYAEAYAQARNW